MKSYLTVFITIFSVVSYAQTQTGVNTKTPQKTLHVNGSLQIVNELNIGGNGTTVGSAGTAGQVLTSNGPGVAPSWQTLMLPTSPVLATGTVIAVNGEVMIASEVSVLMTADATLGAQAANAVPHQITNLTNEVIDNESTFTGSAAGNSFTVSKSGTYQVVMNVLMTTTTSTNPIIGVWNNTDGVWQALISEMYSAPSGRQSFTLMTATELNSTKTYSFRATNTASTTIIAFSSGSSGSGPVTYVSVKRLK